MWSARIRQYRDDREDSDRPKAEGDLYGRILLGRFAEAEEVALTFVFLASDDANYIHRSAYLCGWWTRNDLG